MIVDVDPGDRRVPGKAMCLDETFFLKEDIKVPVGTYQSRAFAIVISLSPHCPQLNRATQLMSSCNFSRIFS